MVSVIIPSYNRYELLLNAIASVKAQTYKDVHIVVIDDCSTDKRYKDLINIGNIGYLCSEKNMNNPSLARNAGIKNSVGDYICFLDDDDSWLPTKLERQLGEMEKNKALFSCTDGYYSKIDKRYIDGNHYQIYMAEVYRKFIEEKKGNGTLPKWITFDYSQDWNYIITSSVMISRELIDKVGLFILGGKYVKWEDWSYWLRCMEHTDCLFIDEPLVFYNDTPRQKWIRRINEIIKNQ